jgi:hypothetical protein
MLKSLKHRISWIWFLLFQSWKQVQLHPKAYWAMFERAKKLKGVRDYERAMILWWLRKNKFTC